MRSFYYLFFFFWLCNHREAGVKIKTIVAFALEYKYDMKKQKAIGEEEVS